jgi:hypothetical protein
MPDCRLASCATDADDARVGPAARQRPSAETAVGQCRAFYGTRNPTSFVSQALGIEEWQLRQAIHAIKRRSGLMGAGRVIIYDDDKVTDERGDELGNIFDEL